MAVPFDNATTLLTTGASALREEYHERFEDMHNRFGATMNRLFKPSKRAINGNGWNIQVRDSNLYGARTDTDLNADFPTPRAFGVDSYKVTLSETPSSNDIRRIALSLQVTHMDIKRKASDRSSAVNWVKDLISQSFQNVGEATSLHRHLGLTAAVCTLTGTDVKNDARLLADCSSISTTGGGRCAITSGSIAATQRGAIFDVYSSTGTYRRSVSITDYNPRDSSIGYYGLNASGVPSSSVDVSDMTSGDILYFSGEFNKGLKAFGYWYSEPTSSDSFFGQNRSDADTRWLLPHKSGPSSSTLFDMSHLDDLCIEMSFIKEDPEAAYIVITTPQLDQRFRNVVGNDVVVQFPTDAQQGKLVARYGFDGMLYRHPAIGRIVFEPDALAPINTIRGAKVGDWECLYAPGGESFEWMPGNGDMGGWYRMPSTTPGNGDTTTYRMDGFMAMADICLKPRDQWQVVNVTAS